jgi:hypothetical protein
MQFVLVEVGSNSVHVSPGEDAELLEIRRMATEWFQAPYGVSSATTNLSGPQCRDLWLFVHNTLVLSHEPAATFPGPNPMNSLQQWLTLFTPPVATGPVTAHEYHALRWFVESLVEVTVDGWLWNVVPGGLHPVVPLMRRLADRAATDGLAPGCPVAAPDALREYLTTSVFCPFADMPPTGPPSASRSTLQQWFSAEERPSKRQRRTQTADDVVALLLDEPFDTQILALADATAFL